MRSVMVMGRSGVRMGEGVAVRRGRRAVRRAVRVGSVHHGKVIVASVMRAGSRTRGCARSARGSRLLAGRGRGGGWVVVVHGRMRLRLR